MVGSGRFRGWLPPLTVLKKVDCQKQMNKEILDNLRKDRYNAWGERQPLVRNSRENGFSSSRFMSRNDLTKIEKSVLFFHDVTRCKGLELVGFSNVKMERPISLSSGIVLYPCFLQSTEGCNVDDPIVRASLRMSSEGRYVYDGWLPISEMTDEGIRRRICLLREVLGAFPLVSGGKFDWEPKYHASRANTETHYYSEKEIQTIETFANTIDGLTDDDRQALLRSIGWLAECMGLQNPESKFLFAVLAIESLCEYIESSDTESALHVFAQNKKTKAERRKERESCIHETLKSLLDVNPTKAVSEAYFNCVGGIKKKLHLHLTSIFPSDDEDVKAFFEKDKSEFSLYDLRHTIAHGSHDIISEEHRFRIDGNAHKVERFALRYIWQVLNKSLQFYNESSNVHASISADLGNAVISDRSMYRGPVDMGLLYVK